MRRRTFLLIVALVLMASLGVGSIYAWAAGSPSKATTKVIVLLKPHGNGSEVVAKLQGRAAKGVYRYHLIAAVAATVSQDTLKALLKDGNVLTVVADRRIPAPKVPTGYEGHKLRGEVRQGDLIRCSSRRRCSSPTPKMRGRSR